jgi:YegS/Rv2252/BmrU family lipid kinase
LLCVNRVSRLGSIGVGAAIERFRAAGFSLLEARCESAAELSPCILHHRDQIDCVIIAGGDGTLNAAGRALVATRLPLGLLPTGTANDFARSVGLPSEIEAAAQVIVDGLIHQIDVGDVNGHFFFNVASVGLAADLAKSLTRDHKRRFGRLSYALNAARLLMRATPFHATLLMGDEKVMVRTLQIAVGNGRFYGGGNVIASGARIDDGHLDLYSLEFAQVWRMALMLPSFKSGGHGAVREVRTARGAVFEILTRKPRPVNADGELVTHTPAVFTQRRGSVSVYVPETSPLVTVPLET